MVLISHKPLPLFLALIGEPLLNMASDQPVVIVIVIDALDERGGHEVMKGAADHGTVARISCKHSNVDHKLIRALSCLTPVVMRKT
jgi:hypothetical protein